METYFYNNFKCTGDKCPITCCMEWKISVDDDTFEKWNHTADFISYVTTKDDDRVIALNKEHKCPYLCDTGLCRLVTEYGEKMLSHTCDIFPRQVNEYEDAIEKSVVICCPHVIDMLKDKKFIMPPAVDNSMTNLRTSVINIIQNEKYSLEKALLIGFYILLDANDGNITTNQAIEQLDKIIDSTDFNEKDTLYENRELFEDLTINYKKEGMYEPFFASLGEKHNNLAKEYEPLLRNVLASELYSNLYLPEYGIEDIIVSYEWIVMEYVMMRHAINTLKSQVTYEKIRECIVITARIMGYGIDDIYEYMEEAFESVIWNWGYMSLLVGEKN